MSTVLEGQYRATASKFRCIMSAVGTTPLQAQGFISGFALIAPWAMNKSHPTGVIYVFTTNQ